MLNNNITLSGRTILVTGAAGFIGSNLVKRLFHDVKEIGVVGIDSMTDYYDVNIKRERLTEIEALAASPERAEGSWQFVEASIADKAAVEQIFTQHQIAHASSWQQQYGDEYVERNLRRMMQFAQEVDQQIVSTLSTQLTWSHVIEILPLKEALQREFYLTMASSNRWSVRTLRKEIDGSLYQPFDKLRINSTDTNDNILYIHTSSFEQRILCRQYHQLAA